MSLSCRRYTFFFILSLFSWLGAVASPLSAQQNSPGKRVALVIGNSGYKNVARLTNPRNDAEDIAAKLRTLKFEVILAIDVDRKAFEAKLTGFASAITSSHTAVIFYAGHGVTVNTESFLLPVDVPDLVKLQETTGGALVNVTDEMIKMSSILAPLQAAKLGIVFLDACRDGLGGGPGAGTRIEGDQ